MNNRFVQIHIASVMIARQISARVPTAIIGLGILAFAIGIVGFGSGTASAEDGLPIAQIEQREVDFAKDVLPGLRSSCLACHNDSEAEAELVLETPESIRDGGGSGPAMIAGKADESLLFQLASHRQEPIMPPIDNDADAEPMTPEQLALLKMWIDQGGKASGVTETESIDWKPLPDGYAPTFALELSRNGRELFAGRGQSIVVFSVPQQTELFRLRDAAISSDEQSRAHLDIVQSLALSPDQQTLVSGGFRCIKIWRRTTNGELLRGSIPLPSDPVTMTVWDDHLVVADSQSLSIRQLSDGQSVLEMAKPGIVSIAPSASGGLMLGMTDGTLHRISRSTSADSDIFATTDDDQPWIVQKDFVQVQTAGDSLVATLHQDGVLRLYQQPSRTEIAALPTGGLRMALSADGNKAMVVTASGEAHLWDLTEKQRITTLTQTATNFSEQQRAELVAGLAREKARVSNEDVAAAEKQQSDAEANAKKADEEQAAAEKAFAEADEKWTEAKQQWETAVQEAGDQTDAEPVKKAEKAMNEAEQKRAEAAKARDIAVAASQRAKEFTQRCIELLTTAHEMATRDTQYAETAQRNLETAQSSGQTAGYIEAVFDVQASQWVLLDDAQRISRFTLQGTLVDSDSLTTENARLVACRAGVATLASGQELITVSLTDRWELERQIGSEQNPDLLAERVTALAFSPDGELLASGGGEPSRGGEIILWKTFDWSPLETIDGAHSDAVYDLRFSPQGQFLASCASDRQMKLIDLETLSPVKTFEGHTGHVMGVDWRADGRTLVTAGADNVIKIWNAKTGAQQKTISDFATEITGVRFMGLQDRFVLSTANGQIQSRASDGGGRPAFDGYDDCVHRICCDLFGKVVAAAGEDGVIRVWDDSGKQIAEFR